MIKVISPGKLILSGEHAVVYGAPACALAVNKTIQGVYQQRFDNIVTLQNTDLNIHASLELSEIFALHEILLKRYEEFTKNKLAIHQVVTHPMELCWFAIAQVFDGRPRGDRPYGFDITLKTNIPLGCGMGSSAALIVNLISGVNNLFDLSLSKEKIYELALTAENLQHGYSSGLDIQLSLFGGMHVFRKGKCRSPLQINYSLPFQYFNSGKPQSTTGECVAFVKEQNFPPSLWQEFETTTLAFISALQNQDNVTLIETIKKNHRLLCKIGVVPKHIQMMIAEIEAKGGAAKICGAGSIRGDNAGIILMTNNVEWPKATPLTSIHHGATPSS